MKNKSILRNKNLWLLGYTVLLAAVNEFLARNSVVESTPLYRLLQESMLFGSTPRMEGSVKNFLIATPVFVVIILALFGVLVFTDKDLLQGEKWSKGTKYLLLPFALLFSFYIAAATADLLSTQREIIAAQNHESCLSDISLETAERLPASGESALLYIEGGDDAACQQARPLVDNIAFANHITILRYDTVYDRESRAEQLEGVLQELGAGQLPCVLRIQEGRIERYGSEEIHSGTLCSDMEEALAAGAQLG